MKVWPWRRAVQLLVLASLVAIPAASRYGHYLQTRQLEKLLAAWEGTPQGSILAAADFALRLGLPDGEGGVPGRRPRKRLLERAARFQGSPWSARLLGVSATDLLAGAESAAASRSVRGVLLVGSALPLLATLLLGRVFCGWICPMGLVSRAAARARDLARFLELEPLALRLPHGAKYLLLAAGLAAALVAGLPVLHHVYPPALFGREAHGLMSALFDSAESGSARWTWAGLTGASLFLVLLFLLETALAPGFWCASLCPGGALYSLAGRWRVLRVRREPSACVDCVLCDKACPMALSPMTDRTGSECDNCAACLDACPTDALRLAWSATSGPPGSRSRRVPFPKALAAAALLLVCAAATARAHHILGIPHYAYDKEYPQAPVMKLKETVGEWEFQLTVYPGRPDPGKRTSVHAYVSRPGAGAMLERPLTLEVRRVHPLAPRRRVFGPEVQPASENLFKFYPTYEEEGNYELALSFPDPTAPDGGGVSTLRFPLVVGEPGSPWAVVGGFGGGTALLLLVVRAFRIKRARKASARALA